MSWINNFLGIDLEKSPNEFWELVETSYNSEGQEVLTYVKELDAEFYEFTKCTANVVNGTDTNFHFEGAIYEENIMLHIAHLVERDIMHNGNYKYLDTVRKYQEKIQSGFFYAMWEKDNCDITLLGDEESVDLRILTNNISDYIKKNKPRSSAFKATNDCALNLFGINLMKSPDASWTFTGYTTNIVGKKCENFKKELVKTKDCPFNLCETEIIGGKTTFYFEGIKNTKQNICNVLSILERDVMHNPLTKDEIEEKYEYDLDPFYNVTLTTDDGTDIYVETNDDETEINVRVIVNSIASCKPEVEDDFVPDNNQMYEQTIQTLKACCMLAQFQGEVVGTEETIDSNKTVFFNVTNRDELDTSDYVYGMSVEQGLPVSIVDEYGQMVVKSLDEVYTLGNVPSSIDNILRIMNNNNYITNAFVLNNDITDITIAVKFEETQAPAASFSEEKTEKKVQPSNQYAPHLEICETTDFKTKVIKNNNLCLSIVGMSYHNTSEAVGVGSKLIIKREWGNIYDEEAYGYYTLGGELVGYVPKREKPFVRLFMAEGSLDAEIYNMNDTFVDTVVDLRQSMINTDAAEGLMFMKVSKEKQGGIYHETRIPSNLSSLYEFVEE